MKTDEPVAETRLHWMSATRKVPAEFSMRVLAFAGVVLFSSCTHQEPGPSGANSCPKKLPVHYADSTRKFSLCLPAGVTKKAADDHPAGSVRFQGFAVPSGTNLVSKQFIIVVGTDPNMQATSANGTFKAGGVTFKRFTGEEGAAGHSIQSIIYVWNRGGQTVDFDFLLNSANLANFPPANRPAQFDYAAQVKSTEEIMKTFHKVP